MTKTPSQTTLLNRLIGLLFLFIWIPASAAPTFPQLEAEDLNGKAYTLPQALPSRNTLVLIAFKREQQKAVNTWIDGLELKSNKLPWLEIPILEDYGSWFKWFVDNGMRKGIKSEYERSKVVTIYTDKASFNQALGIPSENTIYAAVVNQTGEVLATQSGEYTQAKARPLLNLLTPTTKF